MCQKQEQCSRREGEYHIIVISIESWREMVGRAPSIGQHRHFPSTIWRLAWSRNNKSPKDTLSKIIEPLGISLLQSGSQITLRGNGPIKSQEDDHHRNERLMTGDTPHCAHHAQANTHAGALRGQHTQLTCPPSSTYIQCVNNTPLSPVLGALWC